MHAFELMLAPYAIAHLKVALELDQVAADEGSRADPPHQHAGAHCPPGPVRHHAATPSLMRARRAAKLKEHERFTVVIGNPPYDREQRGVGDAGKRKGGVVRYGADGVAPLLDSETAFRRVSAGRTVGAAGVSPLLNAVTKPMKEPRVSAATSRTSTTTTSTSGAGPFGRPPSCRLGPGVVAFITASSYLGRSVDGRSAPPSAERLRRDCGSWIWEARDGVPSRRRTSSTSRPR